MNMLRQRKTSEKLAWLAAGLVVLGSALFSVPFLAITEIPVTIILIGFMVLIFACACASLLGW